MDVVKRIAGPRMAVIALPPRFSISPPLQIRKPDRYKGDLRRATICV
jgi:hypothetical protein